LIDPHPDGYLVSKALAGDTASFVTLCDRHRGRVWRIVCSVCRGADAEDLAQEAVVRAFKALATYQGEAPFEAWFCRIALNLAHDHLRSAWKRRVTLFDRLPDEGEVAESCEGTAERRELQRRVRQAVAALPEAQRVPIWMYYFEGFKLAEVARLENTPEATVRSRLRAGLKKLSHVLGDLDGFAPEPSASLVPHTEGCSA
jgi:RNA polymerase sigma-70 factor (ECF subfamily)